MTLTRTIVHADGNIEIEELTQTEEDNLRQSWFDESKIGKKNDVYFIRDEKNRSDMTYDNAVFLMNKAAQNNVLRAFILVNGGLFGTSMEWTLKDGSVKNLTPTDITNMVTAIRDREDNNYQNARDLVASIEAASTQDELDAIDINSGWNPKNE